MADVLALILMFGLQGVPLGAPDPISPLGLPVRMQVRHADPYAIVALLQGSSIPFPEISTLAVFGFQAPQASRQGQGFVPEGNFVVDPATNAIWYLPKR
jgi:hypothetical protein